MQLTMYEVPYEQMKTTGITKEDFESYSIGEIQTLLQGGWSQHHVTLSSKKKGKIYNSLFRFRFCKKFGSEITVEYLEVTDNKSNEMTYEENEAIFSGKVIRKIIHENGLPVPIIAQKCTDSERVRIVKERDVCQKVSNAIEGHTFSECECSALAEATEPMIISTSSGVWSIQIDLNMPNYVKVKKIR